jgi:hypothetical protein
MAASIAYLAYPSSAMSESILQKTWRFTYDTCDQSGRRPEQREVKTEDTRISLDVGGILNVSLSTRLICLVKSTGGSPAIQQSCLRRVGQRARSWILSRPRHTFRFDRTKARIKCAVYLIEQRLQQHHKPLVIWLCSYYQCASSVGKETTSIKRQND